VTLSIDSNIQYIAEREIESQIKRSSAISGTLIVMNVKTGEILALASKPDFNPNEFGKASNKLWHPRFLDPYEPGSTFKIFTAAAGIEQGVIKADSKLKALDEIVVGGKTIKNSHKIDFGGPAISISKMLEQSVNTATSQVGLKLGPQKFYDMIARFGFGERTGFGMLSESPGIVKEPKNWYKSDVAMITFGQGIAVTPMQLISAISAFANNGKVVRPCLIKKVESEDGKFMKIYSGEWRGNAISGKTAADMRQLLRNVVTKGSGRRASMEGFTVGGKTGTAQKAAPGGRGYMKGNFIASFIGIAPMNDPQIAALVIIDDPKGSIWGESVCGPVFKNVVEFTLRYLNTKPDVL
ncbi:MAG: penicillin-binding protein 2, partial [Candidatus Margulisiibacteriota bacterium]